MENLSKKYYRKYFTGINFSYVLDDNQHDSDNESKIDNVNREILRSANAQYCRSANALHCADEELVSHSFVLKIQYPGLVTGVGITHEAKIEGEFKLGVHFDYTTGLPVVYGSSVKGVVSSVMKQDKFWEVLEVKKDPERIRIFEGLLPKLVKITKEDLIDEIFEGKNILKKGQYRSIYERDIFFDALVVKGNAKGLMLESDSITPHGKNPLKDPKPLAFVRIASGAEMKFRFRLVDSSLLTAEEKLCLFESILLTFGIGAKTNVGYGQFET